MIGIIDDPNGHPVRQDDTGTPAEYKDGPYLLSDAVSLEAPIPVVIVTDDFYVDSAGNLRGVWPMNISGITTGPVNITPPALNTDIAYVGTVLTVSNGTWDGVAPITYSYQWQDTNGPVFVDILGENTNTYTTNSGDIGYRVRCEVIATDANGSAREFSNITYAVSASVAPVNTVLPAITGTPLVGQVLSSTTGTWTGLPPPTFTRQWYRGANPIAGATAASYQLVAADSGQTITCRVTATNILGSATASSDGLVVPDTWSPFTLTAGSNVFGWGYARPPIVTAALGSISNEPYSGAELIGFFEAPDDSQVIVSFLGDVVDELDGYTFKIDGTVLPVVTAASYNPGSGFTNMFIQSFFMLDGQEYAVERVAI